MRNAWLIIACFIFFCAGTASSQALKTKNKILDAVYDSLKPRYAYLMAARQNNADDAKIMFVDFNFRMLNSTISEDDFTGEASGLLYIDAPLFPGLYVNVGAHSYMKASGIEIIGAPGTLIAGLGYSNDFLSIYPIITLPFLETYGNNATGEEVQNTDFQPMLFTYVNKLAFFREIRTLLRVPIMETAFSRFNANLGYFLVPFSKRFKIGNDFEFSKTPGSDDFAFKIKTAGNAGNVSWSASVGSSISDWNPASAYEPSRLFAQASVRILLDDGRYVKPQVAMNMKVENTELLTQLVLLDMMGNWKMSYKSGQEGYTGISLWAGANFDGRHTENYFQWPDDILINEGE